MRSANRVKCLLIGVLATLSACAPLAKVSETRPKLDAQHGTIPELRRSEQAIVDGQKLERSDPNRAVGFYLAGVEAASTELRRDSKDRMALRDYNFALSRVFEHGIAERLQGPHGLA